MSLCKLTPGVSAAPIRFASLNVFSCSRRFRAALALCAVLLSAAAGQAKDTLAPRYKEWLEKDALYIITRDERDAFRHLASDADRDNFIDRFWEVRNTTPGAPNNPYKEEHYRRVEYASQHFSNNGAGNGWATDMGRIYITLGEPKQKARYVVQGGVRGMEIWFYSNSHPALPPFFYIVFYEKNPSDFRLYSPYMDGPQKLVTGIAAEKSRVEAVKDIDRLLGREVALTTLSLIPGEPVNIRDAASSLSSDVMLGVIKGLANHPYTIDALNLRRSLAESVTHRVVLPGELLGAVTVPLRDAQGNIRLHYALRLTQAKDFAIAQSDERFYYSIEAEVKVLTPEGKLIFSRGSKQARFLTKEDVDRIQGKPFGFQGWLPLAPGKYKLEFTLTNVLTKTAFTGEREIAVPAPPLEGLTLSDVVPFSNATSVSPDQAVYLPFTASGIRFTPYVGLELALVPGQDLKFFYQVWEPTGKGTGPAEGKLLADYAYGRPSVSGTAQTLHEDLPREQFDRFGSLVSGKKVPTTDLPTGNYRLTVTVADPAIQQKRFSSLAFHVVTDEGSASDPWDVDDSGLAEYVSTGQADYDRGLSYQASGNAAAAADFFRAALQKNSGNERARARMVDFYFLKGDFARVTELFPRTVLSSQTEEGTILSVADSLDKTGSPQRAADLVESALTMRAPSGPLYLALANYYKRLGQTAKAEATERKGRSLISETPTPPQS
jgi:GWxTD domain-containing protein